MGGRDVPWNDQPLSEVAPPHGTADRYPQPDGTAILQDGKWCWAPYPPAGVPPPQSPLARLQENLEQAFIDGYNSTRTQARINVTNILDRANELFGEKNADYAGQDPNPFVAFDEAAASLGLTREEVWGVFYQKHHRAVLRWVRDGVLDTEDIESRILDMIVYLAILYAMTKENTNE